jgi:hypothetical protein
MKINVTYLTSPVEIPTDEKWTSLSDAYKHLIPDEVHEEAEIQPYLNKVAEVIHGYEMTGFYADFDAQVSRDLRYCIQGAISCYNAIADKFYTLEEINEKHGYEKVEPHAEKPF